jgi:hypothetical protein
MDNRAEAAKALGVAKQALAAALVAQRRVQGLQALVAVQLLVMAVLLAS